MFTSSKVPAAGPGTKLCSSSSLILPILYQKTACSGACAKLSLGLGFHCCAHLSRVDNRVFLACHASVVITGCRQSNSYGGTPWKTSLATLRARPLTRDERQAVPSRDAAEGFAGLPLPFGIVVFAGFAAPPSGRPFKLPRPRLQNAYAVWLFPAFPCFQCIPWLNTPPRLSCPEGLSRPFVFARRASAAPNRPFQCAATRLSVFSVAKAHSTPTNSAISMYSVVVPLAVEFRCQLDGTASPNGPNSDGGNAFAIRHDFLNDGPVNRPNASPSREEPTRLYLIYNRRRRHLRRPSARPSCAPSRPCAAPPRPP